MTTLIIPFFFFFFFLVRYVTVVSSTLQSFVMLYPCNCPQCTAKCLLNVKVYSILGILCKSGKNGLKHFCGIRYVKIRSITLDFKAVFYADKSSVSLHGHALCYLYFQRKYEASILFIAEGYKAGQFGFVEIYKITDLREI